MSLLVEVRVSAAAVPFVGRACKVECADERPALLLARNGRSPRVTGLSPFQRAHHHGTTLPHMAPQLNVADKHDLSPMQALH